MHTYINYDLRVTQMGEDYHLRADCSLAGQETGLCTMPFSEEEIQGFLWQDMALSPKEIGRRLYDAIFRENIGIHLQTSLSIAKSQKDNLRIRLHLNESSQLALLPWEYLYDPTRGDFFALSTQTPIVRYVDMSIGESSMQVEEPLHILVMIADPVDLQPRLDVDREWILLRAAFQDLEDARKIRLHRLPNANKLELQRYLRGNQIDIFHFIGHGYFDEQDGEGSLIFEDSQRQAEPISADALARLLKDKMPRLVYLNSCDTAQTGPYDPLTGTAQKLVQHGIPAVVAMQSAIQDDKAIQIAHEFYLALTDGYPVDAALVEGRKAVFNNNGLNQWGTPVLFMRAPDGILWNQQKLSNAGELENVFSESRMEENEMIIQLPPPKSSSSDNTDRSPAYSWARLKITASWMLKLIAFLTIVIFTGSYWENIISLMSGYPTPPTVTTTLASEPTSTLNTKSPTMISTPSPDKNDTPNIKPSTITATSTPELTNTLNPEPAAILSEGNIKFDCTQVSKIPRIECEALATLYENTDGPNGNGDTGWLRADTICNEPYMECQNGHVVQIYLMGEWDQPFGLTGDLPPEIGDLIYLDVLNLYANELSTLPAEIGKLSHLSSLNLAHNKLTSLPKEIGNLSKLNHLHVDNNQLHTLPVEIGNLSRLGSLSIGMNRLESVPTELWKLSRLEELDLHRIQLNTLPSEIGNLTKLTELTLSNNNLKTLPSQIGSLSRLEILNLDDNQLSKLPAEISGLFSLNELHLNNNDFSTWPAEINTLSTLKELYLSGNLLRTLPVEIGLFSLLEGLSLHENLLQVLPTEIGNLSNLYWITLFENDLQTLPVEIGKLLRLEALDLAGNKLQTLPVEIGNLSNLEFLDIGWNELAKLPAEIGNLTNLSDLRLNDNQLNRLPATFVKLTNVEDLKLEGNKLSVTDSALLDWMNAKDPDWADSHTPK